MLRTATILLCLTCALPAAAQRDSTARTIAIESVDISGRRPMKEIGVQRTELDTLHTMVNGAADDMDGSTSLLNTDLNTLNSQMDTAVQAARRLQEQGGDYFDEVADEVDRTGDLISDTFTRLEPVMDMGVDALDQMTTAVGQLKWVTAEMAAEMLTASTALAKAPARTRPAMRWIPANRVWSRSARAWTT